VREYLAHPSPGAALQIEPRHVEEAFGSLSGRRPA
jgi:hypothetical protein